MTEWSEFEIKWISRVSAVEGASSGGIAEQWIKSTVRKVDYNELGTGRVAIVTGEAQSAVDAPKTGRLRGCLSARLSVSLSMYLSVGLTVSLPTCSYFAFRLPQLSNEFDRQLSCFGGAQRADQQHLRQYLLRVAKFLSSIIVNEEIFGFSLVFHSLHPQEVAKKFIVRNDLLMSCWHIISLLSARQGNIFRCKQ